VIRIRRSSAVFFANNYLDSIRICLSYYLIILCFLNNFRIIFATQLTLCVICHFICCNFSMHVSCQINQTSPVGPFGLYSLFVLPLGRFIYALYVVIDLVICCALFFNRLPLKGVCYIMHLIATPFASRPKINIG